MLTIYSLHTRLLLVLTATGIALSLAGCSSQNTQAASADELKAFNGGNGKMPDDFKAKLQAAQQNGQLAQQQASQAARQKAVTQPTKP